MQWVWGPFAWDSGERAWLLPDGAFQAIDMRRLSDMGPQATGQRNFALFAADDLATFPDHLVLGTGLAAEIGLSLLTRQIIRDDLGLSTTPQAPTLDALAFELLTDFADPTGSDMAKPLVPGVDRRWHVHLGGGQQFVRRFSPLDPAYAPLKDLLRRDYKRLHRQMLDGLIPPDHHRKWLGAQTRKYFGAFDHESWPEFRHPDVPDDLPIKPTTTVSDDFNRADESLDVGNWTELVGDWDVVNNQLELTTDSGLNSCRFDTDLSTDDHYSQITFVVSEFFSGPLCRKDSTATETFYYISSSSAFNEFRITKRVNGSNTATIATESGSFNDGDIVKIEANGSEVNLVINGVDTASGTDTGITGNLRCGHTTSVTTGKYDDFEAADIPQETIVNVGLASETDVSQPLVTTDPSVGAFPAAPSISDASPYSVNWQNPVNWNHPLNKGLLAWWMVVPHWSGGTMWRDVTGRHHGTLTNMDPATDWVGPGDRRGGWGALDVDGTNDYVDIASWTLDVPYTIAGWFRADVLETVGLVSWGEEASNKRRSMFLWNGGSGAFVLYSSMFADNVGGTTALSTGVWYHGAVAVESSNDVTLYLNGIEDGSGTHSPSAFTDQGLNIGRTETSGEVFDGRMDDVRIYNRALTDSEVRQLYESSLQHYPGILRRWQGQTVTIPAQPPKTVNVSVVSESDIGQALTSLKEKAIALAAETDVAQATTAERTHDVTQAVETDTSFAVGSLKEQAIGQALETDTSQPLTSLKEAALGLAAESDTGQPLTAERTHTITFGTETDAAFTVGVGRGVDVAQAAETDTAFVLSTLKEQALGTSVETDTGFGLTSLKEQAIGFGAETDIAQAVGASKLLAMGPGTETDVAFALTSTKDVTLGLSTETDTATGLGSLKTVVLALASETDAAQALTSERTHTITQAEETDASFGVGSLKMVALALAAETDSSTAVTTSKVAGLGLSSETDTAPAVTSSKERPIGLASEGDTAPGVTVVTGVNIAGAAETDVATVTTIGKSLNLGVAEETTAALDVAPIFTVAVGLSLETDVATVIGRRKTADIGGAAETDTATSLLATKVFTLGLATETDTALSVLGFKILVAGNVSWIVSDRPQQWTVPGNLEEWIVSDFPHEWTVPGNLEEWIVSDRPQEWIARKDSA